ncbi:MAG TPA: conjugal transfer protein TraF, partial [Planctomycetota bacterium]|nr:conjugal transfer protein TraF [Planctomycetota bacterium]
MIALNSGPGGGATRSMRQPESSRYRVMERHFVSAIVLAAMFATGGAVKAEEFLIIGPRQMGMGGAGVATTRGSLGTYWNPATLAPPRAPRVDSYFDIALHATASGAATENALREVQDVVNLLDGIDFDGIGDTLEGGDALTPEQVNDILRLAQEIPDLGKNGRGLIASLAPGIQLRVGNWGFSAMGLVYAAGNANIDTAFLSLGNQGLGNVITGNDTPATPGGQAFAGELAGLLADRGLDAGEANRVANEIAARGEDAGVDFADEGFRDFLLDIVDATVAAEGEPVDPNEFFSGNRSGVDVRGIVLQEYAVSYAQPLLGIVSVGATGKILYGRTYFNPFTLEDLETFGDVLDEFTTGLDEDQFNFAFDLGILVQPIEQVSVGLVGKYLNSP